MAVRKLSGPVTPTDAQSRCIVMAQLLANLFVQGNPDSFLIGDAKDMFVSVSDVLVTFA